MSAAETIGQEVSAPPSVTLDTKTDGTATLEAVGLYSKAELIAASGLDLSRWRAVRYKAGTWGVQLKGGIKDELGKSEVVLERLPEPIAEPLRYPKLHRAAPRRRRKPPECVLVVPDSQNGYRRAPDGTLVPLHDRRAWDLAVQAAQRLQPDVIVLLGDMLDLAPWSCRWPTPLELVDTTQPALAELHWWLRRLRRAAADARIIYLEGNHEDRIRRALVERVPEAEGLHAIGADNPALSVPTLLDLSKLHVEYVGPYGARTWLWQDSDNPLRIYHGDDHASGGGATVAKVLRKAHHSSIFGHVHRCEVAWRAVHGPHGIRRIFALTPGTIARVDGVVPAAVAEVDWQQGLGVIRRSGGRVLPSVVPIEDGECCLDGKWLVGRDRLPDIAEAWPAFRWA